jgi:23S rRNA (pseudouridine1915-N3)-methyltransferase
MIRVELVLVGPTDKKYLQEGISEFVKRLSKYCRLEVTEIRESRHAGKLTPAERVRLETEMLIEKLQKDSFVVLLDEKGAQFSSEAFAKWIERSSVAIRTKLVFVIGGPYGVGKKMRDRANHIISLSGMTFSHQMVRLIFLEQLYRAFSIIKKEPYHHGSALK